ncbi:hypothetical protein ENUP19_0257G0058 [Entamoeba nuttalli]|uniref:Long-chain-fatty-acid--CoA ligase, putative n=2 Tax=Entamoeba nuttalli TaxID=412467 RepID=K2H895_ENTNP|nr:long-chain-fatty-acid--CoA ligase, putative [Entamoeba nuttalli P19]EKE38734.1 long-chain-fatty-acid--CoA ligase, putative [Entamoeba nuttalli P19]|eukprot:XP_008858931.1 long-chain-fatty-acid--CoA ligase, putative [Entamoeba nuttalli P19]
MTNSMNEKTGYIEDGHYYFITRSMCSNGGDPKVNEFIRTHTAYECIKRRCDSHPEDDFYGYRERKNGKGFGNYIWLKNKVVIELIDSFSNALLYQFHLKKGDAIGFISRNRYEWYIAQYAMQKNGIIPVPLYATLGEKAIDYIVDLMKINIVIGSLDNTLVSLSKRNPTLKFILFDHEEVENLIAPSNTLYFEDLLNIGRSHTVESILPKMEDICLIVFTSGTSGTPKGAIHTFYSFSHGINSINETQIFTTGPIRNETIFSYLPCAHVLEQQTSQGFMYGGGRVGFISGGISSLVEDLKLCQPTYFGTVPRVLQRIYDTFHQKYLEMGCVVKRIFDIAFYFKLNALRSNTTTYIDWDNIVFYKIKEQFGGKLKFIFNGGAPLTYGLYEWLRVCTGAYIMQSYGLTESCGGCTTCLPGMNDPQILSCGSPCDRVKLRLTSVPELEYFVEDKVPCGEIELSGGPIFKGYYHNDEANKDAFTEDGYFKTGDIGSVAKDGSLIIIDRKKNLFKLAQGEYIAVEPLEGKYDSCPFVSQTFIHGESTDSFIVGIIVPEFNIIKPWLKTKGIEYNSKEDIIKILNTSMKKDILGEINSYVKGLNVPSYELIKNVYFIDEPFSTQNDLLTPSFKLKRMNLKKHFSDQLEILRKEILTIL